MSEEPDDDGLRDFRRNHIRAGQTLEQDWETLVDWDIEETTENGEDSLFLRSMLAVVKGPEAIRLMSDSDLEFVGFMARTALGEVAHRSSEKLIRLGVMTRDGHPGDGNPDDEPAPW